MSFILVTHCLSCIAYPERVAQTPTVPAPGQEGTTRKNLGPPESWFNIQEGKRNHWLVLFEIEISVADTQSFVRLKDCLQVAPWTVLTKFPTVIWLSLKTCMSYLSLAPLNNQETGSGKGTHLAGLYVVASHVLWGQGTCFLSLTNTPSSSSTASFKTVV